MINVKLVQNSLKEFLSLGDFWNNPFINVSPNWRYYHDLAVANHKTEWFGCVCVPLSYDKFLKKAFVKNYGDVLLGLYNHTDKVYDMKHILDNYPTLGGKDVFTLDDFTIWPKEMYIPFQGRSFLPIVGMNCAESFFECSDISAFSGDLHLIYGLTNNENRKPFCSKYILPTKNKFGAEFLVSNNNIMPYFRGTSTCEKKPTLPDYKLDDIVRSFNKTKQLLKKRELSIYEKELVDKAWHPTRHVDWCLDYQEYNLLRT